MLNYTQCTHNHEQHFVVHERQYKTPGFLTDQRNMKKLHFDSETSPSSLRGPRVRAEDS